MRKKVRRTLVIHRLRKMHPFISRHPCRTRETILLVVDVKATILILSLKVTI